MAHSAQYVEILNQWGLLLAVAFYGAHFTLFSMSLKRLLRRKRPVLLSYTVLLFVLATVGIALQICWTQVAFVENRDYPGGSNQFLLDHVVSDMNRAVTALYIAINWLADGLIFYRFYFLGVCDLAAGSWHRKAFLFSTIVPCSIALIVVGIKFFPRIEGLGVNLWSETPVAPGIAYMALSLSINTTLTVVIITRLLFMRRRLSQVMSSHHTQTYTSLVAMLIESASLYTVVALLAVIACGVNSPMQFVLLPSLGQLQTIPPLLITSRLADGRALSQDTYSKSVQTSPSPSPRPALKISLPDRPPRLRSASPFGVRIDVDTHVVHHDAHQYVKTSCDLEGGFAL